MSQQLWSQTGRMPSGRDWRVRYRLDHGAQTVIVLDISRRSDTYGT